MITVIVIFIVYWIVFFEKANHNRVPKTIWTYWEEPDHLDTKKRLPDEAIRSWKEHNPTYEVIILTKKNYQGYVTIPTEVRTHPDLNPDHLSDLIKLWILAERGGIWIDPNVTINRPFDPWLFPKYAEFAATIDQSKTTDQKHPVINPSFMAANPGSEFIKKWRDEFSEIVRYQNIDQYVQNRDHIDHQQITDPIQDVIQIAEQIVLQSQKYPLELLILHNNFPIQQVAQ